MEISQYIAKFLKKNDIWKKIAEIIWYFFFQVL